MRRPVYYPLAYSVAHLVTAYVDSACYITPMSLSPPLDASLLAEVPLALAGDIIVVAKTPPKRNSLALGHVAFSPHPYSVMGLAVAYIRGIVIYLVVYICAI